MRASVLPLSLACLSNGEQKDTTSGLLTAIHSGRLYLCLAPDPNTQLPNRHIHLTVSQHTQIWYAPTCQSSLCPHVSLCPQRRYLLRHSSKMPEFHQVPSSALFPLKWHSHSHPCFAVCSLPGWPDRRFQVAPTWNTSSKVAQGARIRHLFNKQTCGFHGLIWRVLVG